MLVVNSYIQLIFYINYNEQIVKGYKVPNVQDGLYIILQNMEQIAPSVNLPKNPLFVKLITHSNTYVKQNRCKIMYINKIYI